MQILDCTLRDGGYYTDWDFSDDIVNTYINGMNSLPVDYIELGYRNKPESGYMGKFGYTPIYLLEKIRSSSKKKLAIMLNEKSTRVDDLSYLISPLRGLVDMIRLAVDPNNMKRAIQLAKEIKKQGFEVAFNVMYMSKWNQYENFYDSLIDLNEVVDVFNMVDSFGGIMPDEVVEIVSRLRAVLTCKIGFHGHNNMQMGLINTLKAIEAGADSVDSTILGMGRGAGNLNTELLLTYLNRNGLEVDFSTLSDIITIFHPLYEKYQWGTNLPYMISGANSLPQKDVMSLVTNRLYSFDSVVRGLQNKKDKVVDNAKYPLISEDTYKNIIIIGGGQSPIEHFDAIKTYIQNNESIALVFATARHAALFRDVKVPKYFCLVGREAKRLIKNTILPFTSKCVLPPYPRVLGTDVPDFATAQTFELEKIEFTNSYYDSCTTLAIQVALKLSSDNIYIVGYDGYPSMILSEKEMSLTAENRSLFQAYHTFTGNKLVSLTNSLYSELQVESVYKFI